MKLKTAIYVRILAVALPLLAVSGYLMTSYYLDTRDQAIARVGTFAADIADYLQGQMSSAEVVLGVIAHRRAVMEMNPSSCDEGMKFVRNSDPEHFTLTLADATGRAVCGLIVPYEDPMPSFSDRDWFRRVMREDRFVVSKPIVGRMTGARISIFAYPVHDTRGQIVGVITLSHEFHHLPQLPADSTIVVLANDGEVIVRLPEAAAPIDANADRSIAQAALSGHEGTGIGVTPRGVNVVFGYKRIPQADWVAVVTQPVEHVLSGVWLHIRLAAIMLALVLVSVLVLAAFFGRRLEREADGIAATARAIAGGDTKARMATAPIEEFATVARQFNAMLDVREEAERRILKLNRMYAALSETNHAITKITDRARMLEAVCRIAVEQVGFSLVWIGFVDPETSVIKQAAHWGPASGYLDGLRMSVNPNSQSGGGLVAHAIRDNAPQFTDDIQHDQRSVRWRDLAEEYGFKSAGAFPLTEDGHPVGSLNLYSAETDYFADEDLVSLLSQMASDLSFALDGLRRDASRRETEERFRQIAENVREVFWLSDPFKNSILYVSPAYYEVWGQLPEDLYTSPASWLEAIHPDDRERVVAAAMTKQITGNYNEEYRIVRPDGGVRWIHDLAFPIRDADGRVYRIAGVAEDITEHKRMENSLRRSEASLAVAQSIAKLGSWARDFKSNSGTWSAEMYRLFGRAPFLGAPEFDEFMTYLHPDDRDRHRNVSQRVIKTREDGMVEYRTNPERGPVRQIRANIMAVTDESGAVIGLTGTALDVTEIKEAEAQLFQAQKMEALGNLAGGIAHDFNNMLLPILNLTEMTKEDLPADSPVQENLSLVIEAAQRASQLVKQILAFGRRGDRQVEILDISECAAEALRLLRNVLPATITIVDRIESNIGAVQADASELQSIILNLGTNSAHAMTGKAGRLTVALTRVAPDPALAVRHAALSPDRAYARLEVADTGHGMDAATMAKIFNPFFTTKPVGEGTGLGLAMVHGIVENLGGAIEVSSEVGVGTTFVIYVPLVERKTA